MPTSPARLAEFSCWTFILFSCVFFQKMAFKVELGIWIIFICAYPIRFLCKMHINRKQTEKNQLATSPHIGKAECLHLQNTLHFPSKILIFLPKTPFLAPKIIFLHRECSYLLLMSTLGPLRLTLTALSPGRILMIPTHICWLNSVEHYTRLTICTPQGLPKLEYRSIFWEKEYMEPQAIKDTAQIDFLWSVSWPMAVRIWLCCEKIVNLNCSGQVLPTCLGGELPRGRS